MGKNDLIVPFTDGEETALLGTQVFVAEHPWAAERGVMVNLEAGGHRGPTVLAATSAPNGWLVREFTAAPHPVAGSLMPLHTGEPGHQDTHHAPSDRPCASLDWGMVGQVLSAYSPPPQVTGPMNRPVAAERLVRARWPPLPRASRRPVCCRCWPDVPAPSVR